MSVIFVDPVGGLAGDMLLAALIDAGAPEDAIRERLATLPLAGYRLDVAQVVRRGFAGRRVHVDIESHDHHHHDHGHHHHRSLADIRGILERGALGAALDRALSVFSRLAEAEARVHGTNTDAVHFHEVGAVDAIVDIAGIAVALDLLDVDEIYTGTIPLGTGTTHGAHGEFPLPSPATAAILEGWPVHFTGRPWEHTTPTGAAVVAALGRHGPPPPSAALGATGVGFGSREMPEGPPNMTRVMRLEPALRGGVVDVLEATLDDMSPEHVGYLLERVTEAGALDVFVAPVQMKKQRPGVLLTALAERGGGQSIARVVLTHSTTLGVRMHQEARAELAREVVVVETELGPLRVKVARRPDGTRTAAPEYDDARRAALEHGRPLADVYRLVDAAWRARRSE